MIFYVIYIGGKHMYMQFFNFFIGACIGSHALVVVNRYETKDFLFGSSKCDSCQTPLTILDEIPIFSYLIKKGKCSFCNNLIPISCLYTEIISGLLFLSINIFSLSGFYSALFTYFILLIGIFDLKDQEFEINLLFIPTIIALFSPISAYHYFNIAEWLSFGIFLATFLLMNLLNKLGGGDTLIFIILYLFLGYQTIYILLYACLSFMGYCIFTKQRQAAAFIPFIIIGLIFTNA